MAEEPKRKITIVDVRDVPALDPARVGKLDTIVTYQIDTEYRYFVRIPKEEYEGLSPEEQEKFILDRIKADAQWRMRFLGRAVEL